MVVRGWVWPCWFECLAVAGIFRFTAAGGAELLRFRSRGIPVSKGSMAARTGAVTVGAVFWKRVHVNGGAKASVACHQF
jgi:hypothetical protein